MQGKEDRLAPSAEGEAASSSGRRPEEAPGIPYTLVMGLGAAGLAETVYLSWAKLNGSSPLCLVGGDGCTSVLNSAYASLMGLPLPFYGVVAYGLVAALAGLGATGVAKEEKGAERLLEDGLIAGSSALISTSAVLMYVLATRLGGEPCPWCLASAGLSTGIAGLVASGFSAEQLCQRVAPLAAAASASVVLTLSTAFSGNSGTQFPIPWGGRRCASSHRVV